VSTTELPAPRVSVVMPTLNQGRFIEEAVRSVLGARRPDVELVVADGGSSDGTLSRLSALADEFDGLLRWASQPDGGPAQAVNRAVARTRGALIGWLNSDDLYTEGAIERALAHFERTPSDVMAYGEGDHVDEHGSYLERYPTLPPTASLDAFRQGCFICQPTAFFRRDAFDAVGGLDTSLRASFDFDLWLRLFKAYPGRIGFVEQVQALSRLHEAGITLSQRGRVAREGLTVLGRHLGWAPPEWALTWLEELCAQHPFHAQQLSMHEALEGLARDCADALGPSGLAELDRRLAADARLRLSTPQSYVGVHVDGWAGPTLEVRVLQQPTCWRRLRLIGRHVLEGAGPLRLELASPEGAREALVVDDPGPFFLDIDLCALGPGARAVYRLQCGQGFVPARTEPGSADTRILSYRIEGAELMA